MVPMISPLVKSFSYQLNYLAEYIRENHSVQSPDSAFTVYIFDCTSSNVPDFLSNSITIHNYIDDFTDINKLSQAPILSVLGYKIASSESIPQEVSQGWKEGFRRLSKRQVFPADRNTFFYRPIELLGIVLGAMNLSGMRHEDLNWLKETVLNGENKLEKDELWTFILSFYASNILGVNWKPSSLPFLEDVNTDDLALIKWLYYANPALAKHFGLTEHDKNKINKILLERCLTTPLVAQDVSQSAILYFAIKTSVLDFFQHNCDQYSLENKTIKSSLELVVAISERFHLVTKHIQEQHCDHSVFDNVNDKDIGKYIENLESLKLSSQLIIEKMKSITDQRRYSKSIIMNNPQITNIKNQQNIQAPVYGGVAGNVEGNQNNFVPESRQNLAEFASEVQQLLNQLQQIQSLSLQDAQCQIAKDIVVKANNDATWKSQLIQWGQSMGDLATKTTVSEAVKGVIKIALAFIC